MSAIIALNIIATIAHHVTEPEKLREQAEEEAFSRVEEATLKQISKNADQLAAQLAPTMAADWMDQTRARYTSYLGTGKLPPIDITPPNVPRMPFVLPPLDNENKQSGLWQFIPAWMSQKFTGKRTFEAATVSQVNDLEVKPTNAGGDKAEAIPAPFEDNEPKPE